MQHLYFPNDDQMKIYPYKIVDKIIMTACSELIANQPMGKFSKREAMYCMLYLIAFYFILYSVLEMIEKFDVLPDRGTYHDFGSFMGAEDVSLYRFLTYYPVYIFSHSGIGSWAVIW